MCVLIGITKVNVRLSTPLMLHAGEHGSHLGPEFEELLPLVGGQLLQLDRPTNAI
jgi:hypothetical protein